MDDYESEFKALVTAAGRSTVQAMSVSDDSMTGAADVEARLKHADAAQVTIDEAFALVQSMELEVHTLPTKAKRAEAEGRVQSYKVDITRLRQDLRTARLAATKAKESSARSELVGYDTSDPGSAKALEARAKMMDSTNRLQQSSERIQESRRVAAETESAGAALLEDLDSQRQTIARTRENLSGMEGVMSRGRGYLDSMNRRNAINRLVLNGIGAIVILSCIFILVTRLRKEG